MVRPVQVLSFSVVWSCRAASEPTMRRGNAETAASLGIPDEAMRVKESML